MTPPIDEMNDDDVVLRRSWDELNAHAKQRGRYLRTRRRVARVAPERIDRVILGRDHVHRRARAPELQQRRVLPIPRPDALHPSMEREQGRTRDRVL